MNEAERPIVVGLGELLWDVFPDSRRPGGAPANVAFQANQLGCRGIVSSRVGCDPLGDELIDFLTSQGLAVDCVQRDPRHPTGTVTVDTSRADHPDYVIHQEVAWDYLTFDADLKRLAARASAVCFGTLAQRSPVAREAIQKTLEAVRPDCLVVYDVNLRQRWYQRETVQRSMARARIVKLNADEVTVLASLLETGTADPEPFARVIQTRYGVETVCITRAERGCLLVGPKATVDRPGVPVAVADSVGAGDAFTAALIVSHLRGWPLEAQAELANRVGALVASRPGAMPPLVDEFAALLAKRC